jgi:hypothetical protein
MPIISTTLPQTFICSIWIWSLFHFSRQCPFLWTTVALLFNPAWTGRNSSFVDAIYRLGSRTRPDSAPTDWQLLMSDSWSRSEGGACSVVCCIWLRSGEDVCCIYTGISIQIPPLPLIALWTNQISSEKDLIWEDLMWLVKRPTPKNIRTGLPV